eukprot:Rmarinus@m.2338
MSTKRLSSPSTGGAGSPRLHLPEVKPRPPASKPSSARGVRTQSGFHSGDDELCPPVRGASAGAASGQLGQLTPYEEPDEHRISLFASDGGGIVNQLKRLDPEVIAEEVRTLMDGMARAKVSKKRAVEQMMAEKKSAEAMQRKLDTANGRILKLEQELSEREDLDGLIRERDNLREKIAELRKQHSKAIEGETAEQKRQQTGFESELAEAYTLKDEAVHRANITTAAAEREKKLSDELRTQLREAEARLVEAQEHFDETVDMHQKELKEANDVVEQLGNKVLSLNEQLQSFILEKTEALSRLKVAEDSVSSLVEELELERERVGKLARQLEDKEAEVKDLRDSDVKVYAAKSEASDALKQAETYRAEREEAVGRLAAKVSEIDSLHKKLDSVKNDLANEKAAHVRTRDHLLQDVESQIKKLKETNAEAEKREKALQKELSCCRDEVEMYRMELGDKESVQAQLAEARKAAESLEVKVQRMADQIKQMSDRTESQEAAHKEAMQQAIAQAREAADEEIRKTREEIQRLKKESDDRVRRVADDWRERIQHVEAEKVQLAEEHEEEKNRLRAEAEENTKAALHELELQHKDKMLEYNQSWLNREKDLLERERQNCEKSSKELEVLKTSHEDTTSNLLKQAEAKRVKDLADLSTILRAENYDARQELRQAETKLRETQRLLTQYEKAAVAKAPSQAESEQMQSRITELESTLQTVRNDLAEAVRTGKEYKDLVASDLKLLHRTLQQDHPQYELVHAWKLENKWGRMLESQLNRANRDLDALARELQVVEKQLTMATEEKDAALGKVRASQQVFETELRDLEKMMHQQRQQAAQFQDVMRSEYPQPPTGTPALMKSGRGASFYATAASRSQATPLTNDDIGS